MTRLGLIVAGVAAILVFGLACQDCGLWSVVAAIALIVPGAVALTWDSWRRKR